ncbi:transcriptional regulator, TetR family [Lentibacillus halodurans]|uniref:Transcriptional regulator, TetR family n=1 Tax=Lentibacillus halodurans TaxID=237679 RepID=A0A1I0XMB4_9BACI|nr:TetR/AcrR family transcriptional regulator [Lentibacillus halodurans]SFB02044.1 transcriptional regulator, TetR family [Lentibacillus halodurans]
MNTFEKLSEEKQTTILDGATECFADKGYYGASIKEICSKANISNGALYKYFTNKEELFLAVLHKCQEILVENLYEKYTHIKHSLVHTVENYLEEIVKIHQKYPNYIKVYANLGSNNVEHFLKNLHSPFTKSANYIHNMVSEAKANGEILLDISENELSLLLDNYFILFLSSLVSDYHDLRFRFFLRMTPEENLTNKRKIEFILDSITPFLAKTE